MDEDLGLSAAARDLYERLLAAGSLRVGGRVSPDQGTPAPGPEGAQELCGHGLARRANGGRVLVPVSPLVALRPRVEALVDDLLARQSHLSATLGAVDRLQRRFTTTRADRDLRDDVTLLTRYDDVVATAHRLMAQPHRELLFATTAQRTHAPRVEDLVLPDRSGESGVRYRTLYDAAFLRFPAAEEMMRQLREAGEEVRVSEEVPFRLLLVDDDVALVPLMTEGRDDALLVRAPRLVASFRQHFDLLWERATPWLDPRPAQATLTPAQRRVLELMAAGFSDDDVAAQVGVSTRTVRRHLAGAMDRLGVPSRFAAGVAAQRRGWV